MPITLLMCPLVYLGDESPAHSRWDLVWGQLSTPGLESVPWGCWKNVALSWPALPAGGFDRSSGPLNIVEWGHEKGEGKLMTLKLPRFCKQKFLKFLTWEFVRVFSKLSNHCQVPHCYSDTIDVGEWGGAGGFWCSHWGVTLPVTTPSVHTVSTVD